MIQIIKKSHRRLFFDGNSLANFSTSGTSTVPYGQRMGLTCYAALTKPTPLSYFNFSLGGQRTLLRVANFPIETGPMVRKNDIVVFWEICNEAHDLTSDTNGDQLYANVITYCNLVRSYGAKVIVITGIARDLTGYDDADITSRIFACNAQIRANWASFCDGIADAALLPEFDAKADVTNGTYYLPDQTHLTHAGYDLIAGVVQAVVQPML